MKLKIALAQIRTVTGDLDGNTNRIINYINKSIKEKADIIVFPETAITGYCCGSLFDHPHFVKQNVEYLKEKIIPLVPENMVAVIGFVKYNGVGPDNYPILHNSVAVIQGGKIIGTYDKYLLANGSHHEDRKYFNSGSKINVFKVNLKGEEVIIGTPICEDVWSDDHDIDIVKVMVGKGAEIILASNQSYFYYGKQKVRRKMFSKHASKKQVPIIAVNNIGVGDIVKNVMIYDGGSLAYDSNGDMICELDKFKEQLEYIEVKLGKSKKTENNFVPKKYDKYEEIFEALVYEQKEMFDLVGLKKAQLHVSGGLDSAVVFPILVEAMGKENVIAISNPTSYNGSVTKGNAQYIADKLGVKLYWNEMEGPYNALVESHKKAFGEEIPKISLSTMQAVGRTVQGLSASNQFKTGIVATGNHTEIVLGWSSFHDIGSVGVHGIISDLTKVEIYMMAEYINKRYGYELIPKSLYNGETKPAAELVDANEDPFDYWVVSGICAEIIRDRRDLGDIIEEFKTKKLNPEYFPNDLKGVSIYDRVSLVDFEKTVRDVFNKAKISVFKCAQGAPIVIISPTSRGFSNRETIINKYNYNS